MIFSDNQGIKVLRAGASWHGGAHTWSLPTRDAAGAWTPGEWTPSVTPSVCSRGWHLTTQPGLWWSSDERVKAYLAEWDGALARREGDEKFAAERCRLLRELTADELASCGVFLSGSHEVRAGAAWASGSATVTAYDSATVEAYGSATVTAYGSATVRAHDSATVTAYGSATVTAYDSATVEASGSAKAHAAGQSVATAWDGTVVVTRADKGVIVGGRTMTIEEQQVSAERARCAAVCREVAARYRGGACPCEECEGRCDGARECAEAIERGEVGR